MSSALREMRRLELGARKRLGGHLVAIGTETERLANSSARNHPWGHVAAGGLLGLLLGARRGSRAAAPARVRPDWAGSPARLTLTWILRAMTSV